MKCACRHYCKSPRHGFTLIELVVVVVILGIITAMAAPKMFDAAGDARDSSARQNLAAIRNAIQLYRIQNNAFASQPGDEGAFKRALDTVLTVPFPACPVGNMNDDVRIFDANDSLTPAGSEGWAYNKRTSEFTINHNDYKLW